MRIKLNGTEPPEDDVVARNPASPGPAVMRLLMRADSPSTGGRHPCRD
jgi:hypothetical protein